MTLFILHKSRTSTKNLMKFFFQGGQTPEDDLLSSEDEAVASDLDMHALILGGLHQDHECPVKTADEVNIKFNVLTFRF